MTKKTIHEILLRLDGCWDYIVRNPLSQQEITSIEQQVGLPMPDCLKEFLLRVGLFQDLTSMISSHASEFASNRKYLLQMLGHEGTNLFPFLDCEGDVLACMVGDAEIGRIYYFNHETCAIRRDLQPPFNGTEPFFQALLDNEVSHVLRNIPSSPPNTAKSWCVQFTFSLSDPERLCAIMRQSEIIQIPAPVIWRNPRISSAGVVTTETELILENQPVSFSKSEYDGWESPLFAFNMKESVTLYSNHSRIRFLDHIFSQYDLGYRLVDYGILTEV